MPDSPPYSILISTLAAASVALSGTSGGTPARALVVEADPDWDDCCGPDNRGRLAVWGENIVATGQQNGKCATVYALNVVAQVLRCANSTTDDKWQGMARDIWEDTWALLSVVCVLQEAGWVVAVRNAGPLNEDGGCIATELRMQVTVRPRGPRR